jgi:hypothetical protein
MIFATAPRHKRFTLRDDRLALQLTGPPAGFLRWTGDRRCCRGTPVEIPDSGVDVRGTAIDDEEGSPLAITFRLGPVSTGSVAPVALRMSADRRAIETRPGDSCVEPRGKAFGRLQRAAAIVICRTAAFRMP